MLDDISVWAFSVLQGHQLPVRRRKINDLAPGRSAVQRLGPFIRKFQVGSVVQYSDYRKFSVDTDTTFALPK